MKSLSEPVAGQRLQPGSYLLEIPKDRSNGVSLGKRGNVIFQTDYTPLLGDQSKSI